MIVTNFVRRFFRRNLERNILINIFIPSTLLDELGNILKMFSHTLIFFFKFLELMELGGLDRLEMSSGIDTSLCAYVYCVMYWRQVLFK